MIGDPSENSLHCVSDVTYRDNAQILVTKESRRAGRTGLPGKPRTLALPPLDRLWRQGPPNGWPFSVFTQHAEEPLDVEGLRPASFDSGQCAAA